MIIKEIIPIGQHRLLVVAEDGRQGEFDVSPYIQSEAFAPLADPGEFQKVANGKYFVAWNCGADLSADTIEAHLIIQRKPAEQGTSGDARASRS